jgi:hypothetical protein
VKNLTSNLRNGEARMAAGLDNEFYRGVCADVVAKKDANRAKIDSFQCIENRSQSPILNCANHLAQFRALLNPFWSINTIQFRY